MLQDWKTVCKMLLAEQSKEELSHEDTVNLAFMLSASVKRSVQVGIVSTAEAKRVNLSKAQKVRSSLICWRVSILKGATF